MDLLRLIDSLPQQVMDHRPVAVMLVTFAVAFVGALLVALLLTLSGG